MSYWARAEIDRDQIALIPTTLSDRIPEDHSVRLFWELLGTYDWRVWESRYCGCHGQPAIHPRIVAGVLLYGLTQGIRSSPRLEWACGHAVDFMRLAEGRVIDHSTRTAESIEAELAKLDERFDAMLAEAEAIHGQAPEKTLADSGFCTPGNLKALADHPTDACLAPSGERLEGKNQTRSSKPNAAHRDDPRVPAPFDRHDALPPNQHKRLSKEAFLYDGPSDCDWCPMGQPLAFVRIEQEHRDGEALDRRVYSCSSCAGCPLRSSCTDRKRNRRLRSNGRNPLREAMVRKVHSDAGRVIHRQRQSVAESPFGVIKNVMGVRQFLLRGLENVRTEWRWVCTAYNLRILVEWVRRQRDRWAPLRPAVC